jgi:hypothetical protein
LRPYVNFGDLGVVSEGDGASDFDILHLVMLSATLSNINRGALHVDRGKRTNGSTFVV